MGALLGLCLIANGGCNKSPYELAPVTGRVTIDGKPFSAGKVMFAPIALPGEVNSGKAAFGLLGEDGSFQLSTYGENDGAVVGKHWVSLYMLEDRLTDAHREIPNFRRLPALDGPVEVVSGTDNRIDVELTIEKIRKLAGRR